MATHWGAECPCPAFVADVNRPENRVGVIRHEWGDGKHYYAHADDLICERCAAVPDREGATEQLAALLAAHQWGFSSNTNVVYCVGCDWSEGVGIKSPSEVHRSHLAAVIVAAGWEKR